MDEWTCEIAEETPVESFADPGSGRGPWFMIDGQDFGTAPCSDDDFQSVDIDLLRATQRLDRLCLRCSNVSESKILEQLDALDEDISRMCDEFEVLSANEHIQSAEWKVQQLIQALHFGS